MSTRTARGFTLIHLLVLVGVVSVLGIVGLGYWYNSEQKSILVGCANNLRLIGQRMILYSNEAHSQFPRARYDVDKADRPTAFTRPDAASPFANNGPGPNDVTAALWLIARTVGTKPEAFVCPATSATVWTPPAGKTAADFSNFVAATHLSYSVQNPYPTKAAIERGFKFSALMTSEFPIVADLNGGRPGLLTIKPTDAEPQQRAVNSPNHSGVGQNVLYADGHVTFAPTVWAGVRDATGIADNIYTFRRVANPPPPEAAGIVGPSAGPEDGVLLPTAPTGTQ